MTAYVNRRTTWPTVQDRQRWLAVLARANVDALAQAWAAIPDKPHYIFLRSPETGLAQIRARAGGTGQQFNVGEVTLSRCTVLLEDGEVGVGYVTGRDKRHAELVAVFDAMLQAPIQGRQLQADVIDVLAATQTQQERRAAESAATSKVNFFTMVRGDG